MKSRAEAAADRLAFLGMVERGLSSSEIRDVLGVTPQAVHARAKKLGLLRALRDNARAKRPAPPPSVFEGKYEMAIDEIKELRSIGAIDKFRRQRQNARNRGIPWELSLKQWWQIWLDSGKWGCRGRELGGWVMGRIGDVGAYSPGNVYICDHSENATVRSSGKQNKI